MTMLHHWKIHLFNILFRTKFLTKLNVLVDQERNLMFRNLQPMALQEGFPACRRNVRL